MLASKNGFLLYKQQYEPIKKLSDADLGKLMRAVFEYQIEGVEPTLTGEVSMAFEFLRSQFGLDEAKYQRIIERNRENGKLGGRPKTQNNPENPVGLKKPKKADKDKDKGKDITPKPPKGESGVDFNQTYLETFNRLFGTQYRDTPTRRKKLKIRLGNYTEAEVITALENMAANPFYKGKSESGWVADPDYLIRSDENIDKFLNAKQPKKQEEVYVSPKN